MPRDIFQTVITDITPEGLLIPLSNVEITIYQGGTYGTPQQALIPGTAGPFQAPTGATLGPVPEAGATGGPNPFFTGASGAAEFYLEAGTYDIRIRDNDASPRIPTRVIKNWNSLQSAAVGLPWSMIEDDMPKSKLASSVQQSLWDVGDIKPSARDWIAGAEPAGWLLCDGLAKSRTTYAALYAAIGTKYGVGDGSTTFNLPDLRGRFPMGRGLHGDNDAVGDADGITASSRKAKHKHSKGSINITSSGAHTHADGTGIAPGGEVAAGGGYTEAADGSRTSSDPHTHPNSSFSGEVGDSSSGVTDMVPFLVIAYLIKT